MKRLPLLSALVLASLCWAGAVRAGSIDTSRLEEPWPREHVRELEVGRHPVRWRQYARPEDGIFAGVSFVAPTDVQTTWNLTTDYRDLGAITPGVSDVQYLEQSEARDVIRVEIKVLWKTLYLTFEIEREPPLISRFRLANELIGEYRGMCRFQTDDSGGTAVDMATWLKPSHPVPARLILLVQRMVLLPAVRDFMDECERHLAGA